MVKKIYTMEYIKSGNSMTYPHKTNNNQGMTKTKLSSVILHNFFYFTSQMHSLTGPLADHLH